MSEQKEPAPPSPTQITIHGVFLEVLNVGVLLTGDAAVGKSELALELIIRGHRLIADDAPQFTLIEPEVVNGSCPPLLKDFLEVRGLGVLNVRAMFGDTAIKRRKKLHLIINLRHMEGAQLQQMDRLQGSYAIREVLSEPIPEVTLPVTAGREMGILVETAVRQHILRRRGYNASDDFIARQQQAINAGGKIS
jgi:HPr kinase/phosphorylase